MPEKELPNPENISIEIIDGCALIRFTYPQERNPLSISILEKLDVFFDETLQTAKVEKIIFTGSENIFAAGANLREIARVNGETAREYALRGQNLMSKIANAEQTTIAAVNGFCFGGALDLALACDMRIAAPDAVFCHPGANLGIITGWGGTQRLPRLVGEACALEMFLTAQRVDAKEALRIGLIDVVAGDPLTAALENL